MKLVVVVAKILQEALLVVVVSTSVERHKKKQQQILTLIHEFTLYFWIVFVYLLWRFGEICTNYAAEKSY